MFWDTDTFVLPFFVHPTRRRPGPCSPTATTPCRRPARSPPPAAGGGRLRLGVGRQRPGRHPGLVHHQLRERRPILTGEQEHHLGADIGFAAWQYWTATGDEAFLLDEGAEMVLELARFWASRAKPGADGRWHVRGVIGPDEYHEDVDDNAYTNQLAAWLLARAGELAAWLADRHPGRWRSLRAALDLEDGELDDWRTVAAGLVDGQDPETGLIEQHRGFHQLEEVDLAVLRSPTASGEAALGWSRLARLKVIKQADVVLLLALLGERFPGPSRRPTTATTSRSRSTTARSARPSTRWSRPASATSARPSATCGGPPGSTSTSTRASPPPAGSTSPPWAGSGRRWCSGSAA